MGIMQIIDEHPEASLAVVAIGGLLIGGYFLNKNKTGTTTTTGTSSTAPSGLATDAQGRPLVYVPTSTSFTTENIGAQFSNDPSLQSITTGAITTNSPTQVTVSNPVVNNPPPPTPAPPKPKPPTPTPVHTPPPVHPPKYGLKWGALHTVTSDDTNHSSGALSYIASKSTLLMHTTQRAPSNVSISAADIVRNNPGLRTNSLLHIGQTIKLPSWTRIS